MIQKAFVMLLAASLLLSGCSTTGQALRRLEKRKQERYAAYSTLPAEQKTAVDGGKIMVGMNMDAVYIAWGKPSQVLAGESAQGTIVTWIYHGTYMQSYAYWTYGPFPFYGYTRYYPGPYLAHDFYPVPFVRGEVIFEGGVVKQWRTLPSPGPR